jgi:hypothetical protein
MHVIYEKYVNGEPLTDKELEIGAAFFRDLAHMNSQAGPVFKLAASEANRVATALEGFIDARKRNRIARLFKPLSSS